MISIRMLCYGCIVMLSGHGHIYVSCLLVRLSHDTMIVDESFRRRRDSRISVSGSFETPEINIPVSQFEIPLVEQSRIRIEENINERRAISQLTIIFLKEVEAKIIQLETEHQPPEIDLDELLIVNNNNIQAQNDITHIT